MQDQLPQNGVEIDDAAIGEKLREVPANRRCGRCVRCAELSEKNAYFACHQSDPAAITRPRGKKIPAQCAGPHWPQQKDKTGETSVIPSRGSAGRRVGADEQRVSS